MAEIKIEKKKGLPVWALLLGLLVLVLLIWAALTMRNNDRRTAPNDVAALEWSAPVVAITLTEPAPAPVLARCA
jgi:uncharacterized membrane protein YdjX (TVP38/TMEM64 family)